MVRHHPLSAAVSNALLLLPSDCCCAHREPHLVGRTAAGTAFCLPVCATVPQWRYFSSAPALQQRGNEWERWHRCRRRRHQEFSRTAPMSMGKQGHAVMILMKQTVLTMVKIMERWEKASSNITKLQQ